MITDGVDLFTIRCINTYKKSLFANSERKSRTPKLKESILVGEGIDAALEKSGKTNNLCLNYRKMSPVM